MISIGEEKRLLSPSDVLGHLTNALESVPKGRGETAARELARAAFVVVRHMMGQRTAKEAYTALDVARACVLVAQRERKKAPARGRSRTGEGGRATSANRAGPEGT